MKARAYILAFLSGVLVNTLVCGLARAESIPDFGTPLVSEMSKLLPMSDSKFYGSNGWEERERRGQLARDHGKPRYSKPNLLDAYIGQANLPPWLRSSPLDDAPFEVKHGDAKPPPVDAGDTTVVSPSKPGPTPEDKTGLPKAGPDGGDKSINPFAERGPVTGLVAGAGVGTGTGTGFDPSPGVGPGMGPGIGGIGGGTGIGLGTAGSDGDKEGPSGDKAKGRAGKGGNREDPLADVSAGTGTGTGTGTLPELFRPVAAAFPTPTPESPTMQLKNGHGDAPPADDVPPVVAVSPPPLPGAPKASPPPEPEPEPPVGLVRAPADTPFVDPKNEYEPVKQTIDELESGAISPVTAIAALKSLQPTTTDPVVREELRKTLEVLVTAVAKLPPGTDPNTVRLDVPLADAKGAPPNGGGERPLAVRLPETLAPALPGSGGGGGGGGGGWYARFLAALARPTLPAPAGEAWAARLERRFRISARAGQDLLARMAVVVGLISDHAHSSGAVPEDLPHVGWFGPPRPPSATTALLVTAEPPLSPLQQLAPLLFIASGALGTVPTFFFWLRRRRRRRAAPPAPIPWLDSGRARHKDELSRLMSLHARILGLPVDEQARALSREALYDPSLAAQVGTLLQHPSAVARLLQEPALRQVSAAVEDLAPGSHIGDYEVHAPLGHGAIAAVYHARQLSLGRDVALKVSSLVIGGEAQLLAQLDHRNIVKVYAETIDHARGVRLLAMQLVTGVGLDRIVGSLDEATTVDPDGIHVLAAVDAVVGEIPRDSRMLRERADVAELGPIEWIASVGAQLADALHAAHERRILHLDVKPSNILISVSGRPYLTDFNVSVVGAGTNVVAKPRGGTLRYMSPEQRQYFEGNVEDDAEPVDARSDVYSLAVVLAEMLGVCGVAEPARRRLELLLERCLDSDRDRRPESALAMAEELADIARESASHRRG